MKRFVVVQSPVGDLTLTEENGALTGLYFGRRSLEGEEGLTALLERASRQLRNISRESGNSLICPCPFGEQSFSGRFGRRCGTFPMGDPQLWADCPGRRQAQSGSGGGHGNHRNPISIIVPCHRVVGADGSLTGYGGGLENKKFLLALERGGSL